MQLEKEEFEKWSRFRAQKLRNQRNQFEQKQQNELFALQKRIVSGQEEQKKARAMELERLLQKYQNAKKELETQQQNELLRFEKNAQKTTGFFDFLPRKDKNFFIFHGFSERLPHQWTEKLALLRE